MVRTLLSVSVAALLGLATAQEPAPPDPGAAIRAWIGSDLEDRALLDRATAAVLEAGAPGLEALAAAVRATGPDQRQRRIAVETLVSRTVVEVLRQASESGMRYAGQYDLLRPLMPFAGTYLVSLVVDTPDWFPDDMRALVVPALRDLYPKGPERAVVDRLREVAADVDFEAQPLREALTYALAQWGQRDLVQGRLDELRQNAGDGGDTDELHFVRELAAVHYELREYQAAAGWWQRYLDGMRRLELEPNALEFYNAACVFSLAGRTAAGLDAIERCAALVGAGRLDSTVELTRAMFERDPDLRAIRGDARFAAAQRAAFGDRGPGGEERR